MRKETFHIRITEATNGRVIHPNVLEEYDFESDNVFKTIAEIISKADVFAYSKGIYFEVQNQHGHEEKFWATNKGDTMFVKYCTKNYPFPARYTDWDIEPKYLTCLDEEKNEYKYYLMTLDEASDNFNVQYGRIGMKAGEFNYQGKDASKDGSYEFPAPMFWVKYYEKLSKGYADKTELKDFSRQQVSCKLNDTEYKPIEEEKTRMVIEHLIAQQREYVHRSFDVSVPFSQRAIEVSQEILAKMNLLVSAPDIKTSDKEKQFKELYKELVTTLPRKIYNVSEYINRVDFRSSAEEENFVVNVLNEEQELLDNFCDLYGKEQPVTNVKRNNDTVLEANGLQAQVPDFVDKFDYLDRMGGDAHKVSKIIGVENKRTKEAYEQAKKTLGIKEKDCYLFWHGSRTENWWSITKNGMSLNPNAIVTGKMFGNGLYFAPKAEKSIGYTDYQGSYWVGGSQNLGYLALFEVAMGRSYEPTHALGGGFNGCDLRHGCDSVWAYPSKTGLRNEECIVYREEQCNQVALVELDASRNVPFQFELKQAREIRVENPRYFDDDRVITANVPNFFEKCGINSANGKDVYFEYNVDNKTLEVFPAAVNSKLSVSERDYLTDVFMSRFCDNERDFARLAAEIASQKEIPQDIVKRVEDYNKHQKKQKGTSR